MFVVRALKDYKKHFSLKQSFVPAVVDFSSVFLYFLLLWFIFAPRINNALADLLDITQQMKASITVSGQLSFDAALSEFARQFTFFLIGMLVFWTLVQGVAWWYQYTLVHKKVKYTPFMIRFGILTLLFGLPFVVISLVGAKLSFGFPLRQIIVLTITGIIDATLLHVLFSWYSHIIVKKDLISDLKTTLWKGFYHACVYIHQWLGLYIVLTLIVLGIDQLLRLISDFSIPLYLLVGAILLLAFAQLLRSTLYSCATYMLSKKKIKQFNYACNKK